MSFTIRLLIWFKGRLVGCDAYGNKYFEEKQKKHSDRAQPRRWVIYKGNHEASKVPPEWHAWLHYRADKPFDGVIYPWQKPYKPNFTGTSQAHKPKIGTGDNVISLSTKMKKPYQRSYQPWKPNE